MIELTYNWGDNKYTLGDGYGQVAIQTTDGALLCPAGLCTPYWRLNMRLLQCTSVQTPSRRQAAR